MVRRLNEEYSDDILVSVFRYLKRIGVYASITPYEHYNILLFRKNGKEIKIQIDANSASIDLDLVWIDFMKYVKRCSGSGYDKLMQIFTESELNDFCDYLEREIYYINN